MNSDGSLDQNFNNGSGADLIFKTELQADGKILICGSFNTVNGVSRKSIARLNADGSLDASFSVGSGANSTVYATALQADGNILIGGNFTTVNGAVRNRIARLNANGSLDAGFGVGSNGTVYTVALQADGKILIGGDFTTFNSVARSRIARLNADGSLDASFNVGSGANNTVYTAALQADGKINIGGSFTIYNGKSTKYITRIHAGDSDQDGIENAADAFPLDASESVDTDGDGVGDNSDAFPLDASESADTDGDGIGNNRDTTPNGDNDNDTIDNLSDNCDAVANTNQLNADGDAQGDVCDTDDDNDGIADIDDTFPLDASESLDSDSDGVGDNADNCPLISNADQLNTDGDFQGDACDVFVNDPTLLLQQNGTAKGEELGSSVAMGDINKDGVVDLLVGVPQATVLYNRKLLKKAGKIQIISGKDNLVIRTITGSADNQQLGVAIAVVPDQNKDGVPDLVVGEPLADVAKLMYNGFSTLKDAGRVMLYSGSDGRILHILAEGNVAGDHFGAAVAADDVNGDNKPDLIVGAPMSDAAAKNAGQVTVFNGISKKLLYTRNGIQTGEHFGAAVAAANGHLFVGSPQFDSVIMKDVGRVSIFNSNEGVSITLLTVEGSAKGHAFGASVTAANDDWAVGIPLADSTGKDGGSVKFFTGLNVISVNTLNGTTAGDNFGSSLNMQSDVNKDSKNDIAIGSAKFDASSVVKKRNKVFSKTILLKDAGIVQVLSGAAL
ncbi:MAG TPA: thrombospondin type 3 repeat-containing protein [Pseudomonadales bacterium]|nr:thrombospondin type 3 repeat-containing protein [Pseudomonadales bacterium]